MPLSKSLIPPLIAIALFLILANSQEDSTSFSFTSFSPNLSNVTYEGDAFIPTGSSFVRLTGSAANVFAPNSTGRVVYSPPVAFWVPGRQASFQTTITFFVSISGTVGDGLTFFITPVNSLIPVNSYGGNLGIFNPQTGTAPSVFAVEFDYYFTGADAAWDPNYRHVGIDINSRVSRNTTRWNVAFGGVEITAVINYDSPTRTITVLATQSSQSNSLSYVFDLKTILPQQVRVGISGSTGVGVSSPQLRSWSFSSALVLDSTNVVEDKAEKIEEHNKQYV